MTELETQIERIRVELVDALIRAVNSKDRRGVSRNVAEIITAASEVEATYARANGEVGKSAAQLARQAVAAAVTTETKKRLARMGLSARYVGCVTEADVRDLENEIGTESLKRFSSVRAATGLVDYTEDDDEKTAREKFLAAKNRHSN